MTSNQSLGERLIDGGWHQGVLLPSGGYSVVSLQADGTWMSELYLPTEPLEQWIIVSQDCDILSMSEPYVEVMACYWSRNGSPAYMGGRNGNSYRYFRVKSLENAGQRGALIIDATKRAQVPKSVLAGMSPVSADADDDAFGRDLRRWLGGRYSRPALSPQVVEAIQRPIVEGLRSHTKRRPQLADAVEMVRELRLIEVAEAPPYDVDLLMLIRDEVDRDSEHLAELRGAIETWLSKATDKIRSVNITTLHTSQMYVSEYEESQRLSLDQYSAGDRISDASGPVRGVDH